MIAKRGKSIAVLLAVVAIAVAGIAPTQDWVLVTADDTDPFSLTGAELSPALPALVLALAALALTLLFAGKRLSILCGAAMLLLGAAMTWVALSATGSDNSAIAAEIAARTGLASAEAGTVQVVVAFPALAAAGGCVAVIGGVWTLTTSRIWRRQPKSRDKYELRSGALAWDVLDEGEDPTIDGRDRDARGEPSQEVEDARRDNENT